MEYFNGAIRSEPALGWDLADARANTVTTAAMHERLRMRASVPTGRYLEIGFTDALHKVTVLSERTHVADYDLLVIGCGPEVQRAAIAAAKLCS